MGINEEQLKLAAEKLFNDYSFDSELTAFSNLDSEDFYEAEFNPVHQSL